MPAVVLDGQDISRLEPHQRVKRGLVRTFQINQLFDTLTPLETLALTVSQQSGLGGKWWQALGHSGAVMQRSQVLLAQFHLTEVMHQKTSELAYGWVATALAKAP